MSEKNDINTNFIVYNGYRPVAPGNPLDPSEIPVQDIPDRCPEPDSDIT